MPKFMMIICDDEAARDALPVEEQIANLRAKGEWFAAQAAASRSLEGHKLASARSARTVRTGSRVRVTDGPFIEAKEWIGGYAILQMPDIESAVELAKTFPGFDAMIEIRPIQDGPEVMAELMARGVAR